MGDFGRSASTSVHTTAYMQNHVKPSKKISVIGGKRTRRHGHNGSAILHPTTHGDFPFFLVPSFRAIDGELLPEYIRAPAELLLERER
jgi:hypothetical protein